MTPTLRKRCIPYMNFEDKDAITAVNLARLTQSDTVLPPPPGAIHLCSASQRPLAEWCGAPRWQALLAAARGRFSWLYRQPKINVSIECIDKEECTANLESMAKEIVQIGLVANINVLNPIADEVEQGELCDNCWKMVQDEDHDSRGAIWYRLREYMGVTIT
ncbi:hypothetical protein EVJ58_g9808 [Rhodofomes roseus]|uniref:Uncharacterized protein n=1 Tax=Rhodofomes roseus TaxID=34475 RepID=A0A4Y9XUH8_9APHY|nr:hypothetical protein EVJ58_g9808 [Rhodofomes roseus]